MQNELTGAAKRLSIPERIFLVEEIWDTIAEENQTFELTNAQKRELDRRLESTKSNPGTKYFALIGTGINIKANSALGNI